MRDSALYTDEEYYELTSTASLNISESVSVTY